MKKALVIIIGIALAIAVGHYLYTQMNAQVSDGTTDSSMSSSAAMVSSSSSSAAAAVKGTVKVQVEDAE